VSVIAAIDKLAKEDYRYRSQQINLLVQQALKEIGAIK